MKFSHIADCHIGAWREPKLQLINLLSFKKAVQISLENRVDFILISGDLFNSALPGIDKLKEVVKTLKKLKELGTPVYLIPGSHDFSPSGKTMLSVLEEAGLCINVVKGEVDDRTKKLRLSFTIDKKTNAKITGMLGRRGMLERSYYEGLDRESLEKEPGFKIFMFHTALDELKPKSLERMESSPISFLPKGFSYYAGGHVHIVEKKDLPGYKNIVYPGPTFPNSFYELEELGKGGFYIYDNGNIIRQELILKEVKVIKIDAEFKAPELITSEIIDLIKDVKDKILMIRAEGIIGSGKVSDINFRQIYNIAEERGCYIVLRNTSKLKSKEYEEIKIRPGSADEIEDSLINEHAGQMKIWGLEKEKSMIKSFLRILGSEKKEGEKSYEYEDRIQKEMAKILEIE